MTYAAWESGLKGDGVSRSGVCECGLFAIGVCVDCQVACCADHLHQQGDRWRCGEHDRIARDDEQVQLQIQMRAKANAATRRAGKRAAHEAELREFMATLREHRLWAVDAEPGRGNHCESVNIPHREEFPARCTDAGVLWRVQSPQLAEGIWLCENHLSALGDRAAKIAWDLLSDRARELASMLSTHHEFSAGRAGCDSTPRERRRVARLGHWGRTRCQSCGITAEVVYHDEETGELACRCGAALPHDLEPMYQCDGCGFFWPADVLEELTSGPSRDELYVCLDCEELPSR